MVEQTKKAHDKGYCTQHTPEKSCVKTAEECVVGALRQQRRRRLQSEIYSTTVYVAARRLTGAVRTHMEVAARRDGGPKTQRQTRKRGEGKGRSLADKIKVLSKDS